MFGMFKVFCFIRFVDSNGFPRTKKTTLISEPCSIDESRKLAMNWRDKNGTDTHIVLVFEPDTIEV